MSNITTMSSLPKVYAQINKARTAVTVMLGSTTYKRSTNAERIYKAANDYKNQTTQERLDILMSEINPVGNLRPVFGGYFVMNEKDQVFLVGTKVPVGEYLVTRLQECEKEGWDFLHLVNFWRNCLLNPYPDCRDNLFEYCAKYNTPITDLGYVVMYKALSYKTRQEGGQDKDLAHFVGESYDRVKKMKKGLGRFSIYKEVETGNFRLSENDIQDGEELVGNLKELHKNIGELSQKSETIYTDKWTKTMEIRLGQPVQKDHGKFNDYQRRNCSPFGVHAGSYSYVKSYASRDDVVLLALVNPKDLTIVHLGEAKIQTSQYFPIAVMESKGEAESHYDFEEIPSGYFEEDFADYELRDAHRLLEENADNPEEALLQQRAALLGRETRGGMLSLPEAQEGSDTI